MELAGLEPATSWVRSLPPAVASRHSDADVPVWYPRAVAALRALAWVVAELLFLGVLFLCVIGLVLDSIHSRFGDGPGWGVADRE
jgi:hypothetical protein